MTNPDPVLIDPDGPWALAVGIMFNGLVYEAECQGCLMECASYGTTELDALRRFLDDACCHRGLRETSWRQMIKDGQHGKPRRSGA